MERFIDFLRYLLPMGQKRKNMVSLLSEYLEKDDLKDVKYFLKQNKVDIRMSTIGSKKLGAVREYPLVETEDKELQETAEAWNNDILDSVKDDLFLEFSTKSENIRKLIAPQVIGMNDVKDSVVLQLFADDKVHILLLGDPGTGKTEILRSIEELAPISSYGLGSGTSGVGLTIAFKGDDIVHGLLPLANKGVCCVDELNLMKETDRAGLLNAMEKGFVTYDKGNKHVKVDADIRLLASANPKGDRFAGWMVETLKKQLPFDPALLSRFHLVYLVKRPDVKGFVKIAKKIVKDEKHELNQADVELVQEYVKHVSKIKVKFDKKLEKTITDFIEEVKTDEEKFLMEVSPRIVIGVVRLAKASARMEMRDKVNEKDVEKAIELLRGALYYKKDES